MVEPDWASNVKLQLCGFILERSFIIFYWTGKVFIKNKWLDLKVVEYITVALYLTQMSMDMGLMDLPEHLLICFLVVVDFDK